MREFKKIAKRINKRKNSSMSKEKSGAIFKVVTSLMTIYVLFMSFAIYAKKDQEATVFNNVFKTDVSFTKFNNMMSKLLNLRIIDNSKEDIHDQVVSSEVSYIHLGDDYYTSEGNVAIALDDGVITYVNGKDENYTVIVEYDNGIRATYNEVKEVNVYVNDRVYKDDILGSYIDKVEIIFIKDSEKISYEEVVKLI